MTQTNPFKQRGFALLLTIVVISIVLAVGISLLEITVKQISLSTTGRDSEVAFHGAQAAIECAQATLLQLDIVADGVSPLSLDCFDRASTTNPIMEDANRTAHYRFEFNWSNGAQNLCSESDMFVLDARAGAYTKNFSNQGLISVECENGDVCTVVFARGFNRACSELSSLRTVQRELTISF